MASDASARHADYVAVIPAVVVIAGKLKVKRRIG